MDEIKKKRNRQIIDEYDYLGSSCSSMDCTGLIPRGIVDQEELTSYNALYPFGTPQMDQKKTKEPS